jgi:hypothetical protein
MKQLATIVMVTKYKMISEMLYLIGETMWKLGGDKFFSPGHTNKKAVSYGGTNTFFQLFLCGNQLVQK